MARVITVTLRDGRVFRVVGTGLFREVLDADDAIIGKLTAPMYGSRDWARVTQDFRGHGFSLYYRTAADAVADLVRSLER